MWRSMSGMRFGRRGSSSAACFGKASVSLSRYAILGLSAALAVAILVAALGWRRAREAGREAARAAESYRLEVAGIQQARLVEADALRAEQTMTQRRLGESLARAGVAFSPIATVSGTTGPVHVDDAAAAPSSAAGLVPAAPASALPPAGAGGPVCLLRSGDDGEIRVSGAAALTEGGNVAMDGEAWAYGLSPERRLFGGPLRLDLALAVRPGAERRPGWAVGGAVLGSPDGWRYGPAVAVPPMRLRWVQVEPSAALYRKRPRGTSWRSRGWKT